MGGGGEAGHPYGAHASRRGVSLLTLFATATLFLARATMLAAILTFCAADTMLSAHTLAKHLGLSIEVTLQQTRAGCMGELFSLLSDLCL